MKTVYKIARIIVLSALALITIYILTLAYPQPFFQHHVTVGSITIYSDEELPSEINQIAQTAEERIKKSEIYKKNSKFRIFIANDYRRWRYFSNFNHRAGGLSYIGIANIFLRKVDIKNNRLYGNSGKVAAGDRTLDYFLAHEITHQLEFMSMPWYKYSLKENWLLEGYSEYIAHDSQNYEEALRYYLEVPENSGAKRYTRMRTMVTYLLEKENVKIADIWGKTDEYDSVIKKAIPNDKPNIVD